MTQSTQQQDKVVLQLPDYVTISQFKKFQDQESYKTLDGKIKLISNVTKMDIADVKSLPPSIYGQLYKDCYEMFLEQDFPVFLIKYNGKVLGINNMIGRTIGEVADLEASLSRGDMSVIADCLFREVESFDDDVEFHKVADNLEVARIVEFKQDCKKYTLKEYSSDDNLGEDFFNEFPYVIYKSNVAFTLGIGIPYLIDTRNYSEKAMREMVSNYLTTLDGLQQSLIYQKLES